MILDIVTVVLLGAVVMSGGAPFCFGGQSGAPAGWDIKTPSIDVGEAVSGVGTGVFPQRVWIKRDAEWTHILIETKGLKEYLQAAKGPKIFLSLFFDSDGDGKTGSLGKKVGGQEISGFDVSADFSTMQVRDKDGNASSVLNCQVSKWDGKQFSGDISWGTRFNRKMSAAATGDYASFTIPGSILDASPKTMPARIAFDLADAKYVEGKPLIVTLKITEK